MAPVDFYPPGVPLRADGRPIFSNLEYSHYFSEHSPRIVAIPADHNLNTFALAVADWNITEAHTSWYANGWDKDKRVDLPGVSPDYDHGELAGVAMDHSGTFYAAAANSYNISEYSWNSDDPFTLTYVGVIDISGPCLDEYTECE